MTTEHDNANEDTVRRFCEAFSRRDIDEILGFFAPDAVYHNMPFPPAVGTEAIRETLQMFVPGSPAIEFEMRNVASRGPVVLTERVDHMSINGAPVHVPVAGVFELQDGLITAWRDYFDSQAFLGSGS